MLQAEKGAQAAAESAEGTAGGGATWEPPQGGTQAACPTIACGSGLLAAPPLGGQQRVALGSCCPGSGPHPMKGSSQVLS